MPGGGGPPARLSSVAPARPRSDASREELAELAQQANPEEIELGEDEDEDEMDLEPNGEEQGRVEGGGRIPSQRVTKSSSHPAPIQRCAWSSRACQPLCSGA